MLPRDYEEKRDFMRMLMDCPVRCVDLASGKPFTANAKDLSGKGLCILAERACDTGALVEVHIEPENSVLPPLHAVVEVVRVEPDSGGAGFRIGATIREIIS